jgi:hypothetical protein
VRDRAQTWAIAGFLGILLILAAISAFADSEKWQLQVIAIDAKTGEPLTDGARFTKAGVRSEFTSLQECDMAHRDIGGILAHDGIAVYVVCQKVEIERIGT